jgi:lipopolysaccharide transport system permease protein
LRIAEHLATAVPWVILRRRELFFEMVGREIAGRYRGSMMGALWAIAGPLLMLGVFTFVFTAVFAARWGKLEGDPSLFALMLFPGLILYGCFAEVMGRSPAAIVSQPNFVRKVVFPIEMLPAVGVASAGAQAAIGLAVVIAFKFALTGNVPLTAVWLPLVLLPFAIFLCALGWLLAFLGVYLRDIAQVTGVIATAFMFLSPVFYPIEALPEEWRAWAALNPLTLIIEETRKVLILGESPDLAGLAAYGAIATVFAGASLYVFRRARKGFADVL